MHVFSTVKKTISTIKLNLVDKMKRITYLCVILHVTLIEENPINNKITGNITVN